VTGHFESAFDNKEKETHSGRTTRKWSAYLIVTDERERESSNEMEMEGDDGRVAKVGKGGDESN
jgi:hypothetical protein